MPVSISTEKFIPSSASLMAIPLRSCTARRFASVDASNSASSSRDRVADAQLGKSERRRRLRCQRELAADSGSSANRSTTLATASR